MSEAPSFNTKAFLKDNWPDAHHMRAWLAHYGVEIEKGTAYKQWLRQSVPVDQLALTLALLELEKGRPISLASYLK